MCIFDFFVGVLDNIFVIKIFFIFGRIKIELGLLLFFLVIFGFRVIIWMLIKGWGICFLWVNIFLIFLVLFMGMVKLIFIVLVLIVVLILIILFL